MRVLIGSAAAAVVLAVAPAVAGAATITVTQAADAADPAPDDGFCDVNGATGGSPCTLRGAVQTANGTANTGDDEIVLPFDVTLTIAGEDGNSVMGDLDANDPSGGALTIRSSVAGTQRTIAADSSLNDRVIESSNADLNLQDVRITGGKPDGSSGPAVGGGIYFQSLSTGQTLRLDRVQVDDNTATSPVATSAGGGVRMTGPGSLTIQGSSFSSNRAGTGTNSGDGGAISSSQDGPLTVTDSSFIGNQGRGNGGAIERVRTATSGAPDMLTRSRLAGANSAVLNGGGLDLQTQLPMRVIDSEISGNTAGPDGSGGGGISARSNGIAPYNGSLEIIDSTVSGNDAQSFSVSGGGGGILVLSGTGGNPGPVFLGSYFSTIAGNSTNQKGGNLNMGQAASPNNVPITVKGTIVAGGTAGSSKPNCQFTPFLQAPATLGGNIDSANECGFLDPTDLSGANPLINGLASNGGTTQTRALQSGSPAIDRVASCNYPNGANPPIPLGNDQRGYPRAAGGACDSGAYELTICNGSALNTPTPSCPGVPQPPPPAAPAPTPTAAQPVVPVKRCKKKHHRSASAAKKCKKN